MNLKDRMKADSVITEQTKKENLQQNSSQQTSSDTTKRLNQPSLESVVEAQSEAIQKLTAENHLKDETIEDLRNQTQIDLSEMSELRSVIAELRAEISSVQNVNQSIVKENDDLRNSAGLMSRKEQQKLVEKLTTTQDLLSDTKKLVNMSNVTAVENAQAAKQAAEAKARQDIANCKEEANSKVSEAVKAKNDTIKVANAKIKAAKKSQQIAWSSLSVTLLCCLMAYPVFLEDVWEFISAPIILAWDSLNIYAKWMAAPYYSKFVDGTEKLYAYPPGTAWILRILSFALLITIITGICYGLYQLWLYYRKRWCNLSLRVLLVSLAAIIVFGPVLKKLLSINLILIVGILQVLYLGVLIYLDGYFDSKYKTNDWIRIQNN